MIRLLCIGKMKDRALQTLAAEYVKRISSFSRVEVIEVKDEPNAHAERDAEAARIKDAEAERVMAKLRPADLVVLLDLHGRMWDSEGFSRQLDGWQQQSAQKGLGPDLHPPAHTGPDPGTDLPRLYDPARQDLPQMIRVPHLQAAEWSSV